VRLRLMAEMADSSNLVKTLVIKAEDARILSNMALTRKMYQQVRKRGQPARASSYSTRRYVWYHCLGGWLNGTQNRL